MSEANFDARAAIMAGMGSTDAAAPAPAPEQDSAATDAVSTGDAAEAAGAEAAETQPPAATPEPADQPIDVDWRKYDINKLPPDVRVVVDGMKKSLQADYSRKMEEVKKLKEAAQRKPVENAPTFDEEKDLAEISDDPTNPVFKKLAAVNRYQSAQIAELKERAERADVLAQRIADMYLGDKFDAQWDALTREGGDYHGIELDRNVVREIIVSSSDQRLAPGNDMVRNALKLITGRDTEQRKKAQKQEAKASAHALPTGKGGAPSQPLSPFQKFQRDIMQRLGKYDNPNVIARSRQQVQL